MWMPVGGNESLCHRTESLEYSVRAHGSPVGGRGWQGQRDFELRPVPVYLAYRQSQRHRGGGVELWLAG